MKRKEEINMNDQVKALNAEIKQLEKDRKAWNEKALHHYRKETREGAQELVELCDTGIARLTYKRDCIAKAMTRGIFA